MKFLKKMTDLDNAIIATDEEIRYIRKNSNQFNNITYELQKRTSKLDDLKKEYNYWIMN